MKCCYIHVFAIGFIPALTPDKLYVLLLFSHLLIGDRSLFLIGQLHQRADICAQVGLTANEQDPCARTEVQDLSFPLWTQKDSQFSGFIWSKCTVKNNL